MALHFVSYDLRKQRNYQPLWDALKALGARRVLESVWSLHNQASAEQLRNHLSAYIDNDDRLLVATAVDWASLRAINNPHNSVPARV